MIFTTENLPGAIKDLRKKTGLSQTNLAEAAGINIHTISRIERGLASPTIRILEKIIKAITSCQEYRDIEAEAEEKNQDQKIMLLFN